MNIYTLPGKKVKVHFYENGKTDGYDSDNELINTYLEKDKEYTVLRTEVHGWTTGVYLLEFPAIKFNSVCFRNITEQTDEEDHCHPDYLNYN